jgi:hypothetical protein
MNGCPSDLAEHPLLRDLRESAEFRGKLGVGMMIGGGAITVTGIVLAIINRPERVLPTFEVAPTQGGMTASTTLRF